MRVGQSHVEIYRKMLSGEVVNRSDLPEFQAPASVRDGLKSLDGHANTVVENIGNGACVSGQIKRTARDQVKFALAQFVTGHNGRPAWTSVATISRDRMSRSVEHLLLPNEEDTSAQAEAASASEPMNAAQPPQQEPWFTDAEREELIAALRGDDPPPAPSAAGPNSLPNQAAGRPPAGQGYRTTANFLLRRGAR